MTTFDRRKEGFEKKFAHDEELRFKAVARNLKQRIESLGYEDKIFNILVPKEKKIKINWQFSLKAARTKMNSHYTRVNAENDQCKKT